MKSLFRAASMTALLLITDCALVSKRPPYPDPDRLVSVVKVAPAGEEPILGRDFLALQSESKTLERIAAYEFQGLSLTGGGMSERIHSARVSAGFFPALGVNPALGRAFDSEECQPGNNTVVVISHDLWQRRFGADPSLIGRTITLDHEKYTVIGVMPKEFRFPNDRDVWAPLAFDAEGLGSGGESMRLEVIARLKPSVTLQQAQEDVNAVARKLERYYPMTNIGRDIKAVPLQERLDQQRERRD
jgi:putative ABC transport system permease protein